MKTCDIPNCDKEARSPKAAYCPMHYHRAYRHGDVNKVATRSITVSNGRKYKMTPAKGHPLADSQGRVYTHRLVLFETIGPGPHNCHWRGLHLEWFRDRTDPHSIHVDHLNNHTDDNRPENLAASCRRCNGGRGAQRRAEALRGQGFWSVNDTVERLRNPDQRRHPKIAA